MKDYVVRYTCDSCGAHASEGELQDWKLVQHSSGTIFHACSRHACLPKVEALVDHIYRLPAWRNVVAA